MLKRISVLFVFFGLLTFVGCQKTTSDPVAFDDNPSSTGSLSKITVDGSGVGFVGKGDVQYTFGWNNKQLQDNAANVKFSISSTSVTVATWICDRDAGPQTQERNNTTTTTTRGLVSSIGRERNQITGFILSGFDGEPTTSEEHEGPAVGSCPVGWTAIDLQQNTTPGEGSTLNVSALPNFDWTELLEKPL